MKTILILMCLVLLPLFAIAETCEECREGCLVSVPAGDGCNTCSMGVYCKDDKWFSTGWGSCTLLACINNIEISNPFEDPKKKNKQDYIQQNNVYLLPTWVKE